MEKSQIITIMLEQREDFFSNKNFINRDVDLEPYFKTRQIVLISGIRRCGKSSLLYIIQKNLKIDSKNILYFNFDDERILDFQKEDFNKIYETHLEIFSGHEPTTMFFDEIQNFTGWENFLKRNYEKRIKIYVTGSNAKLLSSEIGTALTGRNKILFLFPFSFKEYLYFNQWNEDISKLTSQKKSLLNSSFKDYIKFGGFPIIAEEKDIELVKSYYQDILYRDIITRFKISQIEEIKMLGNYLVTNISKILSYSTLQAMSNIKSLSTLKNYLGYFENSYLFYFVRKFDFSVKKQILNPRKIFVADTALHTAIGFRFSEERGRLLENIVFLELKRRKKEIYYYKGKKECDFIILNGLKVEIAIQVTVSLTDVETRKREINGLVEALISYKLKKGLILTENESEDITHNGFIIFVRPIVKWLLEK